MQEFKNVSILLPTLNETFSFRQTIDIILDECDERDIKEFVVIICERTERESLKTIAQCRKTRRGCPVPIRVIWQKHPGAGGAVMDGMTVSKGSHILMMAPDLETDPHCVKSFIEAARKWPDDMITASRWKGKGGFEGYNRIKFVLNFLFQKIFSLFYGVSLTDITFGYRLAPATLFQSIRWEETGHPFFLETGIKPIRLGVKIHEIPSKWSARQEGVSQNSLLKTFKYLKIAFRVRFENPKDMIRKKKV